MPYRRLVITCFVSLAFATAAQAQESDVVFEDFNHVGVEPDRITIAGGSALLKWKSLKPWAGWGNFSTQGRGKYRYNTCDPSCAEGEIKWTSATVRLSDIATCGGERHYQSLKSRTGGGIGDLKLELDCSGAITQRG
jgi:hypothetical protein